MIGGAKSFQPLILKLRIDICMICIYSETPLIRIPGDQLNLFELEGF